MKCVTVRRGHFFFDPSAEPFLEPQPIAPLSRACDWRPALDGRSEGAKLFVVIRWYLMKMPTNKGAFAEVAAPRAA